MSFDGKAFGEEIVTLVKSALDRQKSELALEMAGLRERIAFLEGNSGEAKAAHKPKRRTRIGGRK